MEALAALGVMFVLVLTGPFAVRVANGQSWMEDSGPLWRPTLMQWSCDANSEGGHLTRAANRSSRLHGSLNNRGAAGRTG